MTNKDAQEILEKYVFWRDVRIPILHEQITYIGQSVTANYSGTVRGSEVSDPTANTIQKQVAFEEELFDLQNKVRAVEYVKEYLDEDLLPVFRFLIYPRKKSWAEITDCTSSGMTEQEFRTRRKKILRYVREAFSGLSLPFLVKNFRELEMRFK